MNIVAMADLFEDQLQTVKVKLDQLNAAKGFPAIQKSNIYQGSMAYLELMNNKDVDANRHKSFISSIETGDYLNETGRGAASTLTAILVRNATEAQEKLTWDEICFSNEKIDPNLNLSQFDKI